MMEFLDYIVDGLASTQQQLKAAYVHSQTVHVKSSDIPTKVSALENDCSFVTLTEMRAAINELKSIIDTLQNRVAALENQQSITVRVTGVSLNNTLSLNVGDTSTLTATVTPSNATNKAVTWSTNNSDVASVNNGAITAISNGTAIITVTTIDGNYSASCTVTVNTTTPTEPSEPSTPTEPATNVIGEYTLNFEDELKSAIATGRYENSNYNAAKKEAAYMKFALSTACQKLHKHGGGTLLFEKLYTVNGGLAAWEIDNCDNVTWRGVGEAGFIKPDPETKTAGTSTGYQHFGYIRHCNNMRFINMHFVGRQTDMPKLYLADYGVEIHGGDGIYFEGCTFKNMNDACLVVGNETVSENDGLHHTRNVYVNKCKFLNCWQTSTTQNGVYNYWFTNNYVAGGATKFAQRLPNGDNIHVLNNVYKVHDSFIGNPLEFCNYNNVWIENNVIYCGANTSGAMSLYYNTHADDNYYSTHKNITIKGNKIYNGKTGVYFNHAVADYPAGRVVIDNNTFAGSLSSKAISIAGYFETLEIKNNSIEDITGIGICIGTNSANAIIDKLYLENNILRNIKKAPIFLNQVINYARISNNVIENNTNYPLIKCGDGTASAIIDIAEIKNNYFKNSYSSQQILNIQTGNFNIATIRDNYIVSDGAGFYNFKVSKCMMYGNYINTGATPMQFPSGNSTTVYTMDNVLSKAITLNGATEIKQ